MIHILWEKMNTVILKLRDCIKYILYNNLPIHIDIVNDILYSLRRHNDKEEIILDCISSEVYSYIKECRARLSFGLILLNGQRNNEKIVNEIIMKDYRSKYPCLLYIVEYLDTYTLRKFYGFNSSKEYLESLVW